MQRLLIAFVLFTSVLSSAFAQTDSGDQSSVAAENELFAEDDVWMISTRHLAEPHATSQVNLMRWNAAARWSRALPTQLCRWERPSATTVVYVHGYGFGPEKAQRVGWSFYRSLVAGLPEDVKVRFVIWSWPSTAERRRFRPRRDLYQKASRTDLDAYYLARWLSELECGGDISLIGSSMGVRIVTGALHLLDGGANSGWRLPALPTAVDRTVSTVLISPALHSDWLDTDNRHGRAINMVDHMLLVNNPSDALLGRYWRIASGTPALGVVGLRADGHLHEDDKKIEQHDASRIVGSNHGIEHYIRSPAIMAKVRETILKPLRSTLRPVESRLPQTGNHEPARL